MIAFERIPKNLRDGLYILLIFDLVFIGTRGIGEVALWKTGSVGYLWGVTLELAILTPFFAYVRNKIYPFTNKYLILAFYFVSLIASMFLEHLSLAVSAVVLYICLDSKLNKKNIPKFLVVSLALHLVGTFLLIFSKGNFARALLEQTLPLSERIITNLNLFYVQGTLGWVLVLFWIIALTNKLFLGNVRKSVIWLIFSLASITILSFAFSPTELSFNYRTAFPFEIFIILAIVYLAKFMPKIAIFEITILLILSVNTLGHGITAYKNSLNIHRQVSQRAEIIESLKKRGEDLLIVPRISLQNGNILNEPELINKYKYISDLRSDPNHWINTCYASAIGLNKIATPPGENN